MAQLDLLPAQTTHMPPSMTSSSLPLKAEDAYKTISEVADELDVPQHVLRFWESHFPQVKPSRMRGSRRYYRPADVELLKAIKELLYNKGYTIKGAKQVVRSGVSITNVLPQVQPPAPAPLKVATTAKALVGKKDVDTKSLVSELRVLKSMLTSLL